MNDAPVEQQYLARVGTKTTFRIGNGENTFEMAFHESAGILLHNPWHPGPIDGTPGWPHDPCDHFTDRDSPNSKKIPQAFQRCEQMREVPESNACDYMAARNLTAGECFHLSDQWLYHMVQLKERRSGIPLYIP